MTIAHLGHSLLPVLYRLTGAIERRMLWLAKYQAARGHQVIVFSADANTEVRFADGVEFRNVKCVIPSRPFVALRDWELAIRALWRLRPNPVDVLHCHSVPEGGLTGKGVARARFMSYDHFEFRKGRRTPLRHLTKRGLNGFDRLLPVSEYVRSKSAGYWTLPIDNMTVVPNGVDIHLFRPSPQLRAKVRRELNVEQRQVILWAGRINRLKGVDLLLEAFRELRRTLPNLALVVAGPADQFGNEGGNEWTRAIVESGGIYLGAVEEAKLPGLFNMCDIFTYPSRNEPFGMAAIEAQACGAPVVSSDAGGLPEVVGEGGVIFASGDARQLKEALHGLLLDGGRRTALGLLSRDNAMRYSWERIVAQLDPLYAQALQPG